MNGATIKHIAIGWIIGLALSGLIVGMLATKERLVPDQSRAAIDLEPLDRMPVLAQGRLKSFRSFARDVEDAIVGSGGYEGLPADFFYLDLMIRPEAYADAPIIFVKNNQMRRELAAVLRGEQGTARAGMPILPEDRVRLLLEDGRVPPRVFAEPSVRNLLDGWKRDLLRTAKGANAVEQSLRLANPMTLRAALRIVPPPDGSPQSQWLSVADLKSVGEGGEPIETGLSAEAHGSLVASWMSFERAWRAADPDAANAALAEFTDTAASVSPAVIPNQQKMLAESWYFKLSHLTWVWLIYLLATFFLLLSVVYRWAAARGIGLGLYGSALALHTVSIGWRWWVSGRWPNANMYEAVTTAFWFGAVVALVLEVFGRRTPLRGVFGLTAAVSSMVAMMTAAYSSRLNLFFELDPAIRNMMPVLHDLWLYIHTNVIIASYALIFAAGVCSVIYLGYRLAGGKKAHAGGGGTAMLLRVAGKEGDRSVETKTGLGAVLDGATMVLIEMSFVLLWAGIVMGAIWADHSWGRPWGWDPKEVFALNTFIVYLVLIHARVTSRDKGLWTAILSVIGAATMIFNWLVINFVIAGLHSYA